MQVKVNELDSKLAYIQVTHVIPFFSKDELDQRLNEFEQNHDVDTFMYETPFTKSGAARGSVEDQWKRKTVIKSEYSMSQLADDQILNQLLSLSQLNTPFRMCLSAYQSNLVRSSSLAPLRWPSMRCNQRFQS